MDKHGYLNNTYYKPDCIILVFNFENKKNYEYMKLCCKYYIKNYNLIYLFGINLNTNNINKYTYNDSEEFSHSNNLKFIRINEDNENYIKNFLNNLLIELEKNEDKNIINQGNIKIMKEIPSKEYEIFLLGDSAIGAKTTLIWRLVKGIFPESSISTLGVDKHKKLINLKSGNKIKLDIWDISGQDRFSGTLFRRYSKETSYFIFGYDVTDEESFNNIRNWFEDVLSCINNKPRGYLIGNKIDLSDSKEVS